MKKVIIIIVILLICCSILGIWIFFNNKPIENSASVIAKDMIKGFENIISFDDKKEDEKEEIQEVEEQKDIPKEDNTQQEQVIEQKQEIENNKPIETSLSKKTEVVKEEKKSSPQPSQNKVETKQEKIVTPTPTPTPQPEPEPEPTPVVETPKVEKSNWCFEGGTKHIAGNGPNEHGYFDTWQQAWDSLSEYMKDFTSGNYYIDQCTCGKYYYYVKQD